MHIHVEELRVLPGIAPMPKNPNRDISFQNDSLGMRIFGGFFELEMQMILNKVIESDLGISI